MTWHGKLGGVVAVEGGVLWGGKCNELQETHTNTPVCFPRSSTPGLDN